MSANTDALTEINLDDLVASFGWQDRPLLTRPLRRLFQRPARAFAAHMVEFDSAMGRLGLPEAARLTQRRYVREVQVFSEHPLPGGPFLALANHPGMTDALSLFAALNRKDLKIIALDRPLFNSLPHTSERLFCVRKDDSASRTSLVRQVSTHLRNGGAALTFPAGHIEPDPDVHEGAIESLQTWTDSVGVFIRMAPETAVVPVLVRGVIWHKAARHPLLFIKRTREERDKLAATLQLLAHVIWQAKPVTVRVQIGRPITAKGLGTTDPRAIHQAVLAEMKRLLGRLPDPGRDG
jgi:hypothetical protein